MKGLQIITTIAGITLAGVGVAMALTNPSQEEYEEFALQQFTVYIKENVCEKAPENFENFLKRQCSLLVETGSPQFKQLIAETTQRQNFIFFSIYRTDLSVSSFLPSYHFESVGAFDNVYIYQAEKQ
jgi:hypothetical protein